MEFLKIDIANNERLLLLNLVRKNIKEIQNNKPGTKYSLKTMETLYNLENKLK